MVEERFKWAGHRETKCPEDQAYALLGIFNVNMSVRYGEGKENALSRLRNKIKKSSKSKQSRGEYLAKSHKLLLESLWFPEIHSREDRIIDAHQKTFEWVFEQGESTGPWSNFVSWLKNDANVYWINGKAGSGKSTLMWFVCHDIRTKQSLNVWSEGKVLLVLSFYFWSGGTQLERSIEGLLRSFLWQILSEIPDLRDGYHNHGFISVWTERRLRGMFQSVVQKAQATHSLCFFVDGLDESTGDWDTLIDLIHALAQKTGVKLCVSSRRDRAFKDAFEPHASLQLQDLTQRDILHYVLNNLRVPEIWPTESTQDVLLNHVRGRCRNPSITWLPSDPSSTTLEDIAEEIVYRAEGSSCG